jgi:eukaryotic-like serine/threonine-protein kinase
LNDPRELAAAAGVAEGSTLASKYRVERVLGAGGMGVVVAALHLALGERVAIKVMRSEVALDADQVARFLREARALARVKGEHVVRVTDVAELPSGAPYMVMEYLEGSDLAHVLRQRGPFAIAEAANAVLQACAALAEAHAHRIIHRDLKPSNLFLSRRTDGATVIKVLDFGISKVIDGGDVSTFQTNTTSLMGTPLYMSPEQLRSSKFVDARTDIWALGVILYELVAGAPPFRADSMTDLLLKIASEPLPSLSAARPDAPPAFVEVVTICTQKDRAARYSTVAELARALQPFAPGSASLVERIVALGGVQGSTLPIRPSAVNAPNAPKVDATGSPVASTARHRHGRSMSGGLLAAALLAVGGLAVAVSAVAVSARWPRPAVTAASSPAHVFVTPASSPPPAPFAAEPTATLSLERDSEGPSLGPTPPRGSAGSSPAAHRPADVVARPPASTRPPAARAPAPPTPPTGASSRACTIVTDYDSDGEPHFRKVCP